MNISINIEVEQTYSSIMKIGVLTLGLNTNYGGVLQCVALMEILKKLGHDVVRLQSYNSGQTLSIVKNLKTIPLSQYKTLDCIVVGSD